MYVDPSLIRDNPVRVNFNDAEAELVNALVRYTGEQRAVLIRRLILKQAQMILSGQADYSPGTQSMERPQQSLFSA
jgi:hypothetical protein